MLNLARSLPIYISLPLLTMNSLTVFRGCPESEAWHERFRAHGHEPGARTCPGFQETEITCSPPSPEHCVCSFGDRCDGAESQADVKCEGVREPSCAKAAQWSLMFILHNTLLSSGWRVAPVRDTWPLLCVKAVVPWARIRAFGENSERSVS